jgi:hypothetical protein
MNNLTTAVNDSKSLSTVKSGTTYAKNGYTYDKRVTAMMVEDMIFDPILATKVILGIDVPPHEELRILEMWTNQFTLDDSGFSTGKSFTLAAVAALRSILFPGRISGILSGTFRQGKLIFQNFDRWHSNSKIFRHCVKIANGKVRLVHGSDLWEAHFRGMSTVRVLPPNFYQDSERLRSERWNDGYMDEWTTFGNFRAFTTTIIGRVTAVNNYPNCPVRQNHIHLSSTPNFTHHPAYKIVKQIQGNIDAGNTDYARMTFNYRHIPKNAKWAKLVNRKVIFAMQTMNPKGVVDAEVNGNWTSDSLSYYSSFILDDEQLRVAKMHILKGRFKRGDVYLAAFDMARGSADSKSRGGGDDFALSVIRVPAATKTNPSPKAEFCCCVRKNNISSEQAAGLIHEYHQAFQFSMIMYDPQGGGSFVRDDLRKPLQLIRGESKSAYPIVESGDTSGTIGDMILVPVRRSTIQISMLWGKMASESVMVNRIHKNMRNLLDMHQIALPPAWPHWQKLGIISTRWEIDHMRKVLNQASGITELDRMWAETDLAIRQLISVDVERDGNGDPLIDKFGMYHFKSKGKKDSAYSLIYVCLLKLIWDQFGKEGGFVQSGGGEGMAVASSVIG